MLELGDYNIGNGALETDGDIEEEAICGGGHGGLGEGVKSDGHEEWEEKKTAGVDLDDRGN
ncbi:unnamed protein product [Prunus armeniaca]